eukprot:1035582-Pyramimonas_sp.AAC.1
MSPGTALSSSSKEFHSPPRAGTPPIGRTESDSQGRHPSPGIDRDATHRHESPNTSVRTESEGPAV